MNNTAEYIEAIISTIYNYEIFEVTTHENTKTITYTSPNREQVEIYADVAGNNCGVVARAASADLGWDSEEVTDFTGEPLKAVQEFERLMDIITSPDLSE